MSAIDPSLLFYQQQNNNQQSTSRGSYGGGGASTSNGQAGMNGAAAEGDEEEEEEDRKPAAREMEMAVDGSNGENNDAQRQESELLELDESAPLDLKDDATLAAFLAKMDEYEPILPDAVTRYYLERAGFQATDDRV